jgi:hypothetical protein
VTVILSPLSERHVEHIFGSVRHRRRRRFFRRRRRRQQKIDFGV